MKKGMPMQYEVLLSPLMGIRCHTGCVSPLSIDMHVCHDVGDM